jgi:hypothetical protein
MLILSLPLFAQMSRTEMQNMYLTYLRSQNIETRIDPEGNIAFQYELPKYGRFIFYIAVYENEPQFFQILTVNVLSSDFENAQERDQAYVATVYATGIAGTVKMYVNSSGTNVWASGEVFLASPGDFRFAFPKIMPEFTTAFDAFLDYMR